MTRIAVDAMGGDYAPSEIVKGAVWAAQDYNVPIELVGQVDKIQKVLDEIARKGIRSNRGGYFVKRIKDLFLRVIIAALIFFTPSIVNSFMRIMTPDENADVNILFETIGALANTEKVIYIINHFSFYIYPYNIFFISRYIN